MANIRLYGVNASNNGGDGVRIAGNATVLINGLTANNNGGTGLNIITKESVYQSLNLPKEISPALISKILTDISKNPEKQSAEKIVKDSELFDYITKAGLNLSSFAANLITISTSATFTSVLAALFS
ncbi:hypothetical protein [Pseudomonas sp. RSP]|uniref:hypothetical protein n=1 Tax=Pseudomonas sp. RSP TaxID=3462641 RepID=UPI00405388A6